MLIFMRISREPTGTCRFRESKLVSVTCFEAYLLHLLVVELHEQKTLLLLRGKHEKLLILLSRLELHRHLLVPAAGVLCLHV